MTEELDRTITTLGEALEGDAEARGMLLEELRPRLCLWASTRLSPAIRAHVDSEDVTQEILLAVHRGLDDFESRSEREFHGWVFRIAENRIRDLADYAGAKKRQAAPITPFSQTSPSTAAMRTETFTHVHRALETLEEDHRRVIRLRYLEEREVADVADRMERSENAVRILYCRALKALKKALPEG